MVENIFAKNQKEIIVQQYRRKFTHKLDNATEYYKLHGSVTNPSEGFVFSTEQYVDTMIQSKDYRFSTLSSDMHSENFIFLGSNFDEINLDYYLKLFENTGYSSSRGKLIFINPSPSILLRSKIERAQGILIEWTTEEFFDFIITIGGKDKAITEYDLAKDIEHLGFINIRNVRRSLVSCEDYDSQLYLGYEPTWDDIYAEWDFVNPEIANLFNNFLKSSTSEKTAVLSLYGKAYIGKSVFLKRLGNELHNRGFETFYFHGRNFNYYPFLQFIRKSDLHEFALLVDNASYYYGPLRQLMRQIPTGKRLLIITTSRPFFHFKWRYNFIEEHFTEYSIEPSITNSYAKNIVLKLDEKGYLGELKNYTTTEGRVYEVVSSNDIMSFLFSLTFGKGFVKRLNRDLEPLLKSDDFTKDLLISLAIFNKLELPNFPLELVSNLTNGRAKEYLKKVDAFIKTTYLNSLQLRSGFFTNNILSSVTIHKKLTLLEDILVFISAQVNDVEHTYWNEIHAVLIKEKSLRKTLGLNSQQIKLLLYKMRNYYSDNFNFWIQLGIAEQREKEFEKALNHFKQAEALRTNSYMVQNAIGRNFLKQANSSESLAIGQKYFEEGEKILINLIENREEYQARAFSTHCYLYEKIQFLQRFDLPIKNKEINKMSEYLKRLTDKDPNDIMARHIHNVLVKFLKKKNKLFLVKTDLHDLSKLKMLFTDYNIDIDELIDEIQTG